MGAEREDTDPTANRVGTEPGLGKASGPTAAAAAVTTEEDAPPPVDFDALHAALGDPLDYHDMGSTPAVEVGTEDAGDLVDGLEPAVDGAAGGKAVRVGESSGRSSATYASARPHTIPPTRAPAEDPNAPAVIVAGDTDTVPSAPPQMTAPLAATPHGPAYAGAPPMAAPLAGPPGSNPHVGVGAAAGGPHGAVPAHPGSGPHRSAADRTPGYPHTPQAFPVQQRGMPQMTVRMPDRPINPRRGKTPTVVVRPRGPSAKQKLVAFMAMLMLVTACGIAVIIWRKPRWLGLDALGGGPSATTSAPAAPSGPLGVSPASAAATSAMSTSTGPMLAPVSPNAAASASVAASAGVAGKKIVKPAPPPPHPTASAPLR